MSQHLTTLLAALILTSGLRVGLCLEPSEFVLPQDREQDTARQEDEERDQEEETEDEDEDEELQRRIRETARRQRVLRRRLSLVEKRLVQLQLLAGQRKHLAVLEEEIEKAAEAGEDDRLEKLEAEYETRERSAEAEEIRLEALELEEGLIDLTEAVEEIRGRELRAELSRVTRLFHLGEELYEKLARQRDEEEADELREEIDALHEKLDFERERLMLKVELHWAREEDEDERVRELKAELRELQGEEGAERPEKMPERRNMPLPVSLQPTDIAAAKSLNFEKDIVPLLRKVCFECHDADSASGDLDLETLLAQQPLVVNRNHWNNIIEQLRVRSMPPADADQPSEADRRTLVAWLHDAIEGFDYTTVRQPGYEPSRRLTHEEYNNTIRDLTGVDVRPTDRFPDDMTANSGFDNSANSLFVQPALLERYLGAAESVVDAAWPEQGDSPGWRKLLGDKQVTDAEVGSIVTRFLDRAFRRPARPEEIQRYVRFFQARRATGQSRRQALRDVLRVALVSPNFLIRTEADAKDKTRAWQITDYELASRLSYFLWASMPDDELFTLAARKRLRDPEMLRAQVDRMLVDPRSGTLGTLFAAQWLGFVNLDRVQRDQIDNPWATDSLVTAMERESALLFGSIVRGNEPIDRLVDADYTWLNEELARHYRIKGVDGEEMRRVSLTDTPRRGILGHGSVLAITSYPGRTSPVTRGNWILSTLLGTPPPPPPPNASEFEDRVAENDRLNQRQKLERHRTNPNCYACHSQIDPLGFAMEEFEWFGRYRRSRAEDAIGQFPGGKPFRGVRGLSQTLVTDRIAALSEQATRKLLSYALCRQLEYYDEATVRELLARFEKNERRVGSLIRDIVETESFRMKQVPHPVIRQSEREKLKAP